MESPEESSDKGNSKENIKKIEQVKKKQTMITSNQINIRKRKFSDSFNEEPDFSLLENFPPSSLTTWEEAVDDVETVERISKDSGLWIYLNWYLLKETFFSFSFFLSSFFFLGKVFVFCLLYLKEKWTQNKTPCFSC